MFISFAEDISSDLKLLKVDTKKSKKMKENHQILAKQFCNIVQLYADVKELSSTYLYIWTSNRGENWREILENSDIWTSFFSFPDILISKYI